MNKFTILSKALEYIEDNLTGGITPEMCARECAYSLSSLQKMFRCAFNIGISDYISRRRLTMAARELIETDDTVLDIAVKYGYNSHEVFTRAFVRLWGITPGKFRQSSGFYEIFPKLTENRTVTDEGGNAVMISGKRFDVSHLYDFIVERGGKYVICFDMEGLMRINSDCGRAAGDLAIAEGLRRIDSAAGDDMLTVRIGGDEFVLITDTDDPEKARETAEGIMALNGGTIVSDGKPIEVSMRYALETIPEKGNIRYNELFDKFFAAAAKRPEKQ